MVDMDDKYFSYDIPDEMEGWMFRDFEVAHHTPGIYSTTASFGHHHSCMEHSHND